MKLRTYGTLDFNGDTMKFRVEPHVAVRIRRVFKDAHTDEEGVISLSTSPAHLVDVDWFLSRYPMEVSRDKADARAWIAQQAAAHLIDMDEVLSVLDGKLDPVPVEMALPPRDYQLRAADIVRRTGRLLCADELGLGKTITALAMIAQTKAFPVVAVVPPHLAEQWRREVVRFLPELTVHVAKTTDAYEIDCHILIISYHKIRGWRDHLAGKALTLIFDECQELRRRDSKKYRACAHVSKGVRFRMGLSATPIYNYGGEFWNVLNILAPDVLGTWSEFANAWCAYSFDREKAALNDPKAFGSYLREQGLMIRRTRASVSRELPPLNRAIHYVDSDAYVLKEHRNDAIRLAKVILERQGNNFELLKASQELSALARLATGIAKAGYVAQFVRMLVEETGESVVLFGWHLAVYDAWKESLDDLGLAWHTGRQSGTQKRKHLDAFINGDAKVLIMSLRSGQGVDGLQHGCCRVVIGELDWSPGVLEQCIGRIFRDGQTEPVIAYYLLSTEGSDPVVADVLGLKQTQIEGVRKPFGEDEAPVQADPNHVKKLAASYLKRAGLQVPEPKLAEVAK